MESSTQDAYHVTLLYPPNYAWAKTFDEIIETVVYGLQGLGIQPTFAENHIVRGSTNIIFGAHLVDVTPILELPETTIIVYNFEQLEKTLDNWNPAFRTALQRAVVWDYDAINVDYRFRIFGKQSTLVPVGFVPELRRIRPGNEDIDVILFGVPSSRRIAVIEALRQQGVRAVVLERVWGLARDLWIRRAKVILNIHQFSATDSLEQVRLSYCLANSRLVVSETPSQPLEWSAYQEGILWSSYNGLVDRCLEALADETLRQHTAARGYALFSRMLEETFLSPALATVTSTR